MKPSTLLERIDGGTAPVILDVRTAREFRRAHVPGATHIPFQLIATRAASLGVSADTPIVVYCGHGPRAWIAGGVLRALGFRNVAYLAGHWAGWRRRGLRRETGSGG